MRRIFFVLSAILFWQPANAQPTPSAAPPAATIGLQELPADQINAYIAKSNAMVDLLNASLRGQESLERYASWVDVKRGPTGKERIIYGLYSIGSSARDAIVKARTAADGSPAIPPLDAAAKDLAGAFETLIPILNDASDYYDRKDYLSDTMAGGKALHAKLMPAANAFVAARARMDALQDQFKALIDRTELDRIEKTEGRSARWHARRAMIYAKLAVDRMPQDPRRPGDLKAFDDAIAAFADVTRDFDSFVRDSGKSGAIDSYPRDILGALRELRQKVGAGRADPTFYSMDYNAVITRYNTMITMANAFR
jgi:hypothetical protein